MGKERRLTEGLAGRELGQGLIGTNIVQEYYPHSVMFSIPRRPSVNLASVDRP